MDADLKATLLEQSKLLKQIASDVAEIKTVVLREARPLTDQEKKASVEAANRRLAAARNPPRT